MVKDSLNTSVHFSHDGFLYINQVRLVDRQSVTECAYQCIHFAICGQSVAVCNLWYVVELRATPEKSAVTGVSNGLMNACFDLWYVGATLLI